MPRFTIRTCRSMVQECKTFRASTLTGEWTTAADGTALYVVKSSMHRRGHHAYYCTLFVCCDGKWYECKDLPFTHLRRRSRQMYYARPLMPGEMVRVERFALSRFVTHGLAHHPDMTRLLNVSV